MVAFGETYIAAFAMMALGMGDLLTGLIATIPIFGGSILQLASPWGIGRLRSFRRWVLLTTGLQTCSLFAFAAVAWVGGAPAWVVFLIATAYWAGGLAAGPAWNTWAEFLVPERIRSTFFARRVRIIQGCQLIGMVIAGCCLRYCENQQSELTGYACLFLMAGIGRAMSWGALARQSESSSWLHGDVLDVVGRRHTRSARLLRSESASDVSIPRFVACLCITQVAVYITGPYFTPYMFKHLELSYTSYMMLLAIAFLGKVIVLPMVGRAVNRWGASRVFWWGSLAIVPIPSFWIFSDSIYFLAGVQFVSGICWATYELSLFLLFFERIPRNQRVAILSYYNVGNALAMVMGAFIGAGILGLCSGSVAGYMTLFVLSGLGRGIAFLGIPAVNSVTEPQTTPAQILIPVAAKGSSAPFVHRVPTAAAVPATAMESPTTARRREEAPAGSGVVATKVVTA